MGEKMTLTAVRDALLEEKAWARGIGWPMAAHKLQQWADALTAHLTQPAQAVDVEAILEVIAELRKNRDPLERELDQCADKLTAALPNANVKEGWGPKYTAVPCHCLTMAQREYCTNRFKCSTVTTQSTSPQPEE